MLQILSVQDAAGYGLSISQLQGSYEGAKTQFSIDVGIPDSPSHRGARKITKQPSQLDANDLTDQSNDTEFRSAAGSWSRHGAVEVKLPVHGARAVPRL